MRLVISPLISPFLRNVSLQNIYDLFHLKIELFIRAKLFKSFTFKLLLINIVQDWSQAVKKVHFCFTSQKKAELLQSVLWNIFTEGLSPQDWGLRSSAPSVLALLDFVFREIAASLSLAVVFFGGILQCFPFAFALFFVVAHNRKRVSKKATEHPILCWWQ